MSYAAEQLVAAAAILSAEQFETVSQIVKAADFTDDTNRLLWEVVEAYRGSGKEMDLPIMAAILEKSKRWKALAHRVEPLVYVNDLCEVCKQYTHIRKYAEIVRDAATDRQINTLGEQLREMAFDSEIASQEKVAKAFTLLNPLENAQPAGFITVQEAAVKTAQKISDQMDRGSKLAGLACGFDDIDERTSGFMNGDLILIAARPSMGKTTYAMNIAAHMALSVPVQVFSLEMPYDQLLLRMIAQFAGINIQKLRTANLDEQSSARMFAAAKLISDMNMVIDDQGALSVDELMMRSRIAARKQKPGGIVIDYLQLLSGVGDTKNNEIGDVSKKLKQLAKEMNCPVFALAQLNRSLEHRTNKRPILSDLRDSGSLEQDADIVQFIYRDEIYNPESDDKGRAEIHTAKFRNGQPGTDYLESQLEYGRFANMLNPRPPGQGHAYGKPLSGLVGGSSQTSAAANALEDF